MARWRIAVKALLDLRLEIAGLNPSRCTVECDLGHCCSHTLSSASEVTTLWRYINQFKFLKKYHLPIVAIETGGTRSYTDSLAVELVEEVDRRATLLTGEPR